jgi:hypothetical protein
MCCLGHAALGLGNLWSPNQWLRLSTLHHERIAIQFHATFQPAAPARKTLMMSLENRSTFSQCTAAALCLAAAIGSAAILVGSALIISGGARATPVFAGQTGQPCSRCHTSPTGGKDLTDFGKEFKANGNQIKK